jgi:hypothetical protein
MNFRSADLFLIDCAVGSNFRLRRAAGADQLDHLATELRWEGWSRLRHRGVLEHKCSGDRRNRANVIFLRRVPGKSIRQIGICFCASLHRQRTIEPKPAACSVSDFSKNQPAILGSESVPSICWKLLPVKCPLVGICCRTPCLVQSV